MFYYVLQFLYDGKWHIDYYVREARYSSELENDRVWLAEAARTSVDRLNLRKKGVNRVAEANLFELTNGVKADGAHYVVLSSVPADALANIPLLSEEA